MSTLKILYSFSLFILTIAFTSGCNQTPEISEEESIVTTPVTVTGISFKPLVETIDLPAVSMFLTRSSVRSSIAGTVLSSFTTQGERVKKDQPLFVILTREASAMGNSLKRDSSLAFDGRIRIDAPKEGTISSVSHQNGDFVQEGDELAVIAEQNSIVFILDTPFEYVKYIESNRNCKILLPDNQVISANISRKLPEMDPQAQTVRYIIVPVGVNTLPANLNVVVTINKSSRVNATILPRSAVLSNETQTEFWVMKLVDDSTAIRVNVTKGYETSDEIEISAPVFLTTDRIVMTGSYGLPDTARVIIK